MACPAKPDLVLTNLSASCLPCPAPPGRAEPSRATPAMSYHAASILVMARHTPTNRTLPRLPCRVNGLPCLQQPARAGQTKLSPIAPGLIAPADLARSVTARPYRARLGLASPGHACRYLARPDSPKTRRAQPCPACRALPCHTEPRRVSLRRAAPAVSNQAVPGLAEPRRARSRPAVPAGSRQVDPGHARPRRAVPRLPCSAPPGHAPPVRATPAASCHVGPRPATPRPAVPGRDTRAFTSSRAIDTRLQRQ